MTAVFERRRDIVLYTCRCEQCGHAEKGSMTRIRFAQAFTAKPQHG